MKIQDGRSRHAEFRKMSISWDGTKIFHQILCTDASRQYGDGHVNRNRKRKLICVIRSPYQRKKQQ